MKKNQKFMICLTFGILLLIGAFALRGTGNSQLIGMAVIVGILLLVVSYHMYKDPNRYKDDDDDDDL